MKKKIMLAIETAVGNGSLSLFENGFLLDAWGSEAEISRSDRFLPMISDFLNKNRIEKVDLDLIAVSRGPGNYTGTRIGLATALGLKNGLGIPCVGVSILNAMAVAISSKKAKKAFITAILTGKNEVIRKKFIPGSTVFAENPEYASADYHKRAGNKPELQLFDYFIDEIKSAESGDEVILEDMLFTRIQKIFEKADTQPKLKTKLNLKNIGDNLSTCVGKAAILNIASDNLSGIYIKGNSN